MTGPNSLILALLFVAAIALAVGGAVRVIKHKDRHKGSLMLLAALVFLVNVLIWIV